MLLTATNALAYYDTEITIALKRAQSYKTLSIVMNTLEPFIQGQHLGTSPIFVGP